MSAPLRFTLFTSTRPAALTKRFALTDGALVKHSSAQMVEGTAKTVECADLTAFDALLAGLSSAQALTYGIAPDYPDARVQPQASRTEGSIARTREFFQYVPKPGIFMIDHDGTADGEPLQPEELRAKVLAAVPELIDAPMLWRPSASSCIVNAETGEAYTGIKGQRLYIAVNDASLVPKAGAALYQRLWASGFGWMQIGKAGQVLSRSLVDDSVWQPERLDFAGPPVLAAGLKRELPASIIWGDPAERFDLRRLTADADVRRAAREVQALDAERVRPHALEVRERWADERAPALAKRAGLVLEAARTQLVVAAERKVLPNHFELIAQGGETVTVGDLLRDASFWHGKRFADPLEPTYGDDDRIARANLRGGAEPHIYSHAHGGMRYLLARPKTRIQLGKGQRSRVVDDSLEALRKLGTVFDHGDGGGMARLSGRTAVPVTREWLCDYLDRTCAFSSVRVTMDGPVESASDAPPGVSIAIMAKGGERRLPRLDAVVTAPTLRRDGSVLDEPGYDAESGLLYLNDSSAILRVPKTPTREQALAALRRLWKPFSEFPFVDDSDCAVMLAALFTAVLRGSLPTAPGFAFDAPSAGSGKTLLARAVGILATGSEPAISSPAGEEEEMRKRLFASLREGERVILWDNLKKPLGGASIDAFLTAPTFTDRILGVSETAKLPNRAMFMATGNNVRLVGDTCRRVLLCRIDPKSEQPFNREFGFDPAALVAGQREQFVVDCLTIIRAYLTSGAGRVAKGRTASFEDWDDLARQPIVWISKCVRADVDYFDMPMFGDPTEVVQRQFDEDPETQKLAAVLHAWACAFGKAPTTVNDAMQLAEQHDQTVLREAFFEVAGQNNGKVNSRMLGAWIAKHRHRRCNGQYIERGTLSRGYQQWMVLGDPDDPAPDRNNPPQPTLPTTSSVHRGSLSEVSTGAAAQVAHGVSEPPARASPVGLDHTHFQDLDDDDDAWLA